MSSAPSLVQDGATLTLRISTRTPLGTRRVTVRATGDGSTLRRSLWLTVTRSGRLRFSVTVRPARQIVARGGVARYKVRVLRSGGPAAPVSLRAQQVPAGERATFTNGELVVETSDEQETGTHRLVVAGTTWIRGQRVRRFAIATLSVVTPRPLGISGDRTNPLFPGASVPLDLILTNPHDFDLRVVRLRVNVRPRTSQRACSGTADYAVRQYAGPSPFVMHPGSRRLSTIVPDRDLWPQIAMHDLPSNQDACKGATLALDYTATATR